MYDALQKLICLLIFVIGTSASIHAQGWSRGLDVPALTDEVATVALPDGSFAVVGDSGGRTQIVRLTAKGALISDVLLGIGGARFAAAAGGGDLVIGGVRTPSSWLVRLSQTNDVQWAREYTGVAWGAITTARGQLVVTGQDGQAAVVAELGNDGAVRWAKSYDKSGMRDYFAAIAPAPENGFIVAGYTQCGAWLARLGPRGDVLWQTCHRRGAGYFRDVTATPDGGFLAVGRNRPPSGGAYGLWLVKTTASGDVSWAKYSDAERNDQAYSVVPSGSGWIVLARSESFGLRGDQPLVLRLDAHGAIEWQRVQGLAGERPLSATVENPKAIAAAPGGGAFMAAYRPRAEGGTNLRMVHIDASGATGADCALLAPSRVTLLDMEATTMSLPVEVAAAEVNVAPLTFERSPQTTTLQPFCSDATQASMTAAMAATSSSKPVSEPADTTPRELTAYMQAALDIYTKARSMFLAAQYDELEQLARAARTKLPPDVSMTSHLESFYAGLSPTAVNSTQSAAPFEAWVRARPKSGTAHVALASALMQQAWIVRGAGFSHAVSPKGSSGYEKLRTRAREALAEAAPLAGDDPVFHYTFLQATEWEDGAAVVEKAWKTAPYMPLLAGLMQRSLPQWGGTNEDRRAVLELALKLTRSEGAYAILTRQAVTNAAIDAAPEQKHAALGLSWPRARDAYRKWIALRPTWRFPWHVFARAAAAAGDQVTLRELLARPELSWGKDVESIWSRTAYEAIRRNNSMNEAKP